MSIPTEEVKNVRFLKLTFSGYTADEKISFQIPHPREDLTKEIIQAAMDVFISANIFDRNAVETRKKVSAEIIERTVLTTDFDISA